MNRARNSNGTFGIIHNGRRTPLYRIWCAMKERCNNPHNKRFSRYGARGIRVCEEWSISFNAFREWAISNGYKKGMTIDRIDNEKGYEPSNCRWATIAEQNRNYSRNHLITFDGETLCVTDWANKLGINQATILYRLKNGKTIQEALSKTDGRKTRWKTTSPNCTASM